jgi:AcrR family transcriptional regulator
LREENGYCEITGHIISVPVRAFKDKNVFLERGFGGASVDEIADVARAGKPTIYARFPGKEGLFAAVMARKVSEKTSSYESISRLASIASTILRNVLEAETVGLARAAIAEARRFPDLAASIHRMARERTSESVAQLLGELPASEQLPGFAVDRRAGTARRSQRDGSARRELPSSRSRLCLETHQARQCR